MLIRSFWVRHSPGTGYDCKLTSPMSTVYHHQSVSLHVDMSRTVTEITDLHKSHQLKLKLSIENAVKNFDITTFTIHNLQQIQ